MVDPENGTILIYRLKTGDVLEVKQHPFGESVVSWLYEGLIVETNLLIQATKT